MADLEEQSTLATSANIPVANCGIYSNSIVHAATVEHPVVYGHSTGKY